MVIGFGIMGLLERSWRLNDGVEAMMGILGNDSGRDRYVYWAAMLQAIPPRLCYILSCCIEASHHQEEQAIALGTLATIWSIDLVTAQLSNA